MKKIKNLGYVILLPMFVLLMGILFVACDKTMYNITLGDGCVAAEGGSISVSKTSAKENERIDLTITPNDGWDIDEILLDGEVLNENYFTMPDHDVCLTASWKKVAATYKVIMGDGCKSSDNNSYGHVGIVNGTNTNWLDEYNVKEGETVVLRIYEAYESWGIDEILLDGVVLNENSFVMPNHNVTITASWKEVYYETQFLASEGGSVEIIGHGTSNEITDEQFNEMLYLKPVANDGYYFSHWEYTSGEKDPVTGTYGYTILKHDKYSGNKNRIYRAIFTTDASKVVSAGVEFNITGVDASSVKIEYLNYLNKEDPIFCFYIPEQSNLKISAIAGTYIEDGGDYAGNIVRFGVDIELPYYKAMNINNSMGTLTSINIEFVEK